MCIEDDSAALRECISHRVAVGYLLSGPYCSQACSTSQ